MAHALEFVGRLHRAAVHLDLVELVRMERPQLLEGGAIEPQRLGQRTHEERVAIVEPVFREVEHRPMGADVQ